MTTKLFKVANNKAAITIELTKIFLTRDIETDQETFRLFLKKYFMAEKK